MPALPACLLEPLWDQFAALLPVREEFVVGHPLGCHRRRIPDRTVFEHVVLALVHGSGYERISTPGCSDRTIRRRLKEWSRQGISKALHVASRPGQAGAQALRRLRRPRRPAGDRLRGGQ